MMKKLGILALALLLLSACDDGGEKKAQALLESAKIALAKEDFNEAKIVLDSVKSLYPKAFNARKERIKLMQQVDLKEQQKSLVFLDSMLRVKQKEFEGMKSAFVLEKDTAYQTIGNYFYPTQTVEKNINRSYLRGQVNEQGVMALTSIYCGPSNIHHTAVRVTATDGTFAETPSTNDSYETSDLGVKIEKADYKLGNDGGVIGFIRVNEDKPLKIEYIGDRNYKSVMSASDRKAIARVHELSQVLSAIEQIKKEIKEANLKIEFVTRKMQEKS